jgi:dCMP deaminase
MNNIGYDLTNQELVRPKWDTYFLRLAEVVATRSNCMKRAVGAVIVNDLRIVSTGYNGTPFGCANCNDGGCQRCNDMAGSGQRLDECLCIHAEENAVIEAGRAKANGGTIYVTLSPCLTCTKSVVQAGIKRIVYNREYMMPAATEFWKKLEGKVEIVQMSV